MLLVVVIAGRASEPRLLLGLLYTSMRRFEEARRLFESVPAEVCVHRDTVTALLVLLHLFMLPMLVVDFRISF